jgi:hypothetical protein
MSNMKDDVKASAQPATQPGAPLEGKSYAQRMINFINYAWTPYHAVGMFYNIYYFYAESQATTIAVLLVFDMEQADDMEPASLQRLLVRNYLLRDTYI